MPTRRKIAGPLVSNHAMHIVAWSRISLPPREQRCPFQRSSRTETHMEYKSISRLRESYARLCEIVNCFENNLLEYSVCFLLSHKFPHTFTKPSLISPKLIGQKSWLVGVFLHANRAAAVTYFISDSGLVVQDTCEQMYPLQCH